MLAGTDLAAYATLRLEAFVAVRRLVRVWFDIPCTPSSRHQLEPASGRRSSVPGSGGTASSGRSARRPATGYTTRRPSASCSRCVACSTTGWTASEAARAIGAGEIAVDADDASWNPSRFQPAAAAAKSQSADRSFRQRGRGDVGAGHGGGHRRDPCGGVVRGHRRRPAVAGRCRAGDVLGGRPDERGRRARRQRGDRAPLWLQRSRPRGDPVAHRRSWSACRRVSRHELGAMAFAVALRRHGVGGCTSVRTCRSTPGSTSLPADRGARRRHRRRDRRPTACRRWPWPRRSGRLPGRSSPLVGRRHRRRPTELPARSCSRRVSSRRPRSSPTGPPPPGLTAPDQAGEDQARDPSLPPGRRRGPTAAGARQAYAAWRAGDRRAQPSVEMEPPVGRGRMRRSRQPDDGVAPSAGRAEQRPHQAVESGQRGRDPGRVRPARMHRAEGDAAPASRRDHSRIRATWVRFARA